MSIQLQRLRVNPFAIPPTMVAIERLVPGMRDKHWKRPMRIARFSVIWFSSFPLLNIFVTVEHEYYLPHLRALLQQPIQIQATNQVDRFS